MQPNKPTKQCAECGSIKFDPAPKVKMPDIPPKMIEELHYLRHSIIFGDLLFNYCGYARETSCTYLKCGSCALNHPSNYFLWIDTLGIG